MRISLFGPFRVVEAGRPIAAINTNRLQSLIAYLILYGDAPQPRERLAFVLWPAQCNLLVTDHFTSLFKGGGRIVPGGRR